jgi:hypothetical protein
VRILESFTKVSTTTSPNRHGLTLNLNPMTGQGDARDNFHTSHPITAADDA